MHNHNRAKARRGNSATANFSQPRRVAQLSRRASADSTLSIQFDSIRSIPFHYLPDVCSLARTASKFRALFKTALFGQPGFAAVVVVVVDAAY